jgi:cytoskeletal protein RodZ
VSPIVWELGLVVVSLVGFWIWQSVTLKRDMERTQAEKRRREAEAARRAAPGDEGGDAARRDGGRDAGG